MNKVIVAWLIITIIGKWMLLAGIAFSSIVAVGILHDVIVGEARKGWLVVVTILFILIGLGIWGLSNIEWRN